MFYDPDDNANSYLNGGTYSLVNGGYLAPEGSIEVETGMNSLPSEWILEQNYPNPFNPSTTIEYQLPKTANVTISIYEINGKLIKEILNRKQNEGVHRVIWDGTNQNNIRVASGIYIYTIKSDNLLASKKLILIK